MGSKNHYVSQFHLRRFAVTNREREEKWITLFNVANKFYYEIADIENEAKKKNFYGADGSIEKAFQVIEDKIAPCVKNIIESNTLPKVGTNEHILLLIFCISNNTRNPVLKNKLEEANEFFKSNLADFYKEIGKGENEQFNVGQFTFENISEFVPILFDLNFKLIINNMKIPFITSDNPTTLYNTLHQQYSNNTPSTGYAQQGLQIFMPLSPKLLLLFYDPQVYYVGKKKGRTVLVDKTSDIDQINKLQITNCYKNIYGNELMTEEYALKLLADLDKNKINPNPNSGAIRTNNDDDFDLEYSRFSANINLNLSFIFLSTFATRIKTGDITYRKAAFEISEIIRKQKGL